MSKNIIIQKDGVDQMLNNVTKIKTKTPGGGTTTWIESEIIPLISNESVSVLEGSRSEKFYGVQLLETRLQGGGTCVWEAETLHEV